MIKETLIKTQSPRSKQRIHAADCVTLRFILIPFKTVGLVLWVQSLFKLCVFRQFKKGLVLTDEARNRTSYTNL